VTKPIDGHGLLWMATDYCGWSLITLESLWMATDYCGWPLTTAMIG
jgi:hypothetical protein